MDLQNLMPQQAQPISRITNGQLPAELAELTEEVLQLSSGLSVLPSSAAWVEQNKLTPEEMALLGPGEQTATGYRHSGCWKGALPGNCWDLQCSYDGDDAE